MELSNSKRTLKKHVVRERRNVERERKRKLLLERLQRMLPKLKRRHRKRKKRLVVREKKSVERERRQRLLLE